ncbi:hypothetical protein Dimus_009876 [Dionaea muscipula]
MSKPPSSNMAGGYLGAALLMALVVCWGMQAAALGQDKGRGWRRGREEREEEEEVEAQARWRIKREEEEMHFLSGDAKRVVRTEAGEMRVVKGYQGRTVESPLHIGFITMEPRSLFIPHYLDANLIIFLRRGEAKIGMIYKDAFVERRLKMGDLYRIPAGSVFYIVNVGEGQRLHIICSISIGPNYQGQGMGTFQSFFVAGGGNPTSVLAGFDPQTLSNAFNVTVEELQEIMTSQDSGPIVYIESSRAPRSIWSSFLELKQEVKLQRMKELVPVDDDDEDEEAEPQQEQPQWWLRKMLRTLLLGQENKKSEGRRRKDGPHAYNLYERKPDFRNNYGWSIALDHHDYHQLKKSGLGVYYVNLSAGSMMAPHVNPTATEYGIVLKGSGTIQIVYPNGTSAMKSKVKEGSVFWVPKYFPFCQIASRSGPFEFFGFTTSSHRNRPQFLVGARSIIQSMSHSPEIATAFGLTKERFREIVDAQREAVILPTPAAAAPPTTR